MNKGPKHNEIYSMSVMAPTISTHFMLYSLCSQIICWANHFPTISECWFYCIQNGKKRPNQLLLHIFTLQSIYVLHLKFLCDPYSFRMLRLPHFYTINTQSGKVVNLMHQPPLLPGDIPGTHFCQSLSQLQGHKAARRIRSMKIPMTPLGIEPTSFQLIAQWLNSHTQEKILAYLCTDSNRHLTGLTMAHSTLQPVKWWNQQWMQQNSPQHNIIFCTFDQQPARLKSYTHLQECHMLEQKSQRPAFKIYTLIHVLLAHDMALAVSCRPPNTELWVLFLASACHLWWTKCQWHGHFSLYFGILLALSFHEGSNLIFHSSATNTIPTQQLTAMLNRTLFLSCDFHLRVKFKSNQFTCLVECPRNGKIFSHPAMSQSTNLYKLRNNKYIHADCMSVHFHSSCKPNAPIKRPKEVYLSQHGHSRNFSKSVMIGGGGPQ